MLNWKSKLIVSRSSGNAILIVVLITGMFSIPYMQNTGMLSFLGIDSPGLETIEFDQTSTFLEVDLSNGNGQPTIGYLNFSGELKNLSTNGTETTLFTLIGSNRQREVVELPVVLDKNRKLNIGGLTRGGSSEAIPLPPGQSKFSLSINSDLVLIIAVGDATAIARSGYLASLGLIGLSELVLEPSVATSRSDGLLAISGTYFPSNKQAGSGNLSSLSWLLFIALTISVFAFVRRKLRTPTLPIAGISTKVFLATAALVSFITTGTAIVVMLLSGPSPFVEPDVSSMSDWLDTLAASEADPYSLAQSAYPPASYTVMKIVSFNYGSTFFLSLAGIAIGILGGTVGTLTRFANSWYGYLPGVTISLSFSVWFALDRGNTDLIISGLVAAIFSWSLLTRNSLPAITSGIVSSLKWFTLPVSILGLKDQKSNGVRILSILLLTFVLANLAAVLAGSFQTDNPLSLFIGGSSLIDIPLEKKLDYSISIWSWFYLLADYFTGFSNEDLNDFFGGPLLSYGIPVLLISLLFIFLWKGNIDRWRSSTIMAIGICLLSPVSYVYKATILIACLALISTIARSLYWPTLTGVLFALFISAPTFLSFQEVTIASWISSPIGVGLAFTLIMSKERSKDRDLRAYI